MTSCVMNMVHDLLNRVIARNISAMNIRKNAGYHVIMGSVAFVFEFHSTFPDVHLLVACLSGDR